MATLYIVATPIGNLEDVTLRALRVLAGVSVLACEDTRRTSLLLRRHGLPRPGVVLSYHDHNEQRSARRILDHLNEGQDVAVCSNAGYPGLSDPGYTVIALALEAGHLTAEDACGSVPIQGLLSLARRHHLQAQLLDLRNSGDTAGPRDQVVGYAAIAFR